jgi:RNA polymerase-binding transcription factor DksA
MATKKPLKAGKAAVKASKPPKKVASKKTISSKATKSAVASKPAPKKVKKQGKTAAAPAKKQVVTAKKVAKVSNSTAKLAPAKSKVRAKEVVKKTKEQVKKTPVTDKKETTKAVAPAKKVATPEKKIVKAASEKIVTPEVINEAAPTTKAAASKSNGKLEDKKPEKVKNEKPVVIPKTSTDKKVDYDPDFTKSVLDTPAAVPGTPTMRYSDAELQEFRDLINKKLDSAKKELAYLQGLITRRDEMGGDETDNRYMTMEDGGMSMEREQLSQMASRQITFIDHLEKALMRIENKTYGICRVTGKLIDKARLRAVPHATLSMEAKLGITK